MHYPTYYTDNYPISKLLNIIYRFEMHGYLQRGKRVYMRLKDKTRAQKQCQCQKQVIWFHNL